MKISNFTIVKKLSVVLTLVLIASAFLISSGCKLGQDVGQTPIMQIGIRGYISQISSANNRGSILVEGQIEQDTVYDKAMVTINSDTLIQKDDMSRLFEFSDLKVGDRVEVTFTGPVAESYPVQGTAAIVRIITK